jgi:hypothetical protein
MLGGDPDGDGAEAGPGEDEVKEFRYRGKTVKVNAEQHELLEDLRREARGANGRIGSELARTKERLARMEGMLASRQAGGEEAPEADLERLRPDPKLATRDIDAWTKQNDIYQDAKVARRLEQLETKYREDVASNQQKAAEAARTQAWADRFYATYDHFDDPLLKKVVTDAYLEHRAEIDNYGEDVEQAHERLAELADDRLLRLRKAGKLADPEDPNANNRRRLPTFESSARATPRGEPKEKPDESRRNFSASSWSAKERLRLTGREPRKER